MSRPEDNVPRLTFVGMDCFELKAPRNQGRDRKSSDITFSFCKRTYYNKENFHLWTYSSVDHKKQDSNNSH